MASAKFVRGPRARMLMSPGCSLTLSMRKSAAVPVYGSPYMDKYRLGKLIV